MMKTTEETIVRFSLSQRSLHWIHVITWLGLLITGLFLFSPYLRGRLIGGYSITLKLWHDLIAIPFILLPILIYFLGISRGRKKNPEQPYDWLCITRGKFRPLQKLDIWITLIFGLGFTISGGIIWGGPLFFPLFILDKAYLVHDILTYASLAVVGIHILYIIFVLGPHNAMLGMVLGKVKISWAREKFPRWMIQ